jgi:hypothetical protein
MSWRASRAAMLEHLLPVLALIACVAAVIVTVASLYE